jgi:hypothetical protein
VTAESDQDPDPHESALVWHPGSVPALKPVRIRNSEKKVNKIFARIDSSNFQFLNGILKNTSTFQFELSRFSVSVLRPFSELFHLA